MQTLTRELIHTIRQFGKQPGFTSIIIFTLALAIGASTLIFSVVEAVLLRPLPFHDPGRVVAVKEHVNLLGEQASDLPAPDVLRFVKETHGFARAGGFTGAQMEFSGHGEPVQLQVTRLTAGVFPTLGVDPILGRFFTQREDEASERVAVLSYRLWQSRFHGDTKVLGQRVALDRKPYVVIGVMPRSFEFPLAAGRLDETQLWVPMSFTPYERQDAGDDWQYGLVARLRNGVTRQQAEAQANRVAKSIQAEYPARWGVTVSASLIGLKEETVKEARPLITVLFSAVMVVLLVACANVAGLLLIRAIRRQREVAVRVALGAPASAVVRQPMTESLLLSCGGAALGVFFADTTLHAWTNLLPDTLPRISEIGINWRVACFAVALAMGTGFLCGLVPAFTALRTTVNDALRQSGRGGQSAEHARMRSALVVGEIAVAMVLLTAAGLLAKSFEQMREVNPGFRPERVVAASYTLPGARYQKQPEIDGFNEELLRRLQRVPGVNTAGLATRLPMSALGSDRFFEAEGYVEPPGTSGADEANAYVVGDFFRAMRIPLLRGRYFNERDTADTSPVIVVNRTLAARYWPGQDPIGKRMRWNPGSHIKRPWMTVVGEVSDTKQGPLDSKNVPQAYEPMAQYNEEFGALASKLGLHGSTMWIAARTAYDPQYVESALRQKVRSMDRQLPVSDMQTMEQAISRTEAPRRFNTTVILLFALTAIGLAALGIYTVMAFSVAQRTHEIGIRVALGAQASNVMNLVVSGGLKLGLIGCVFGVVGAIVTSRWLSTFLFQVSPFDIPVYGVAVCGVLVLAGVASLLPAVRAAAIDPMEALRVE